MEVVMVGLFYVCLVAVLLPLCQADTDTVAPLFEGCPQGTILFTIPAGQTQANARWNIPTATDAVDPNPTVTASQDPGFLSAGTYNIVYTARDASGNTAYCSFIVQVNPAADTVAPLFAGCPQGTILFTIPAGQTQTFARWNIPTATDAVDPNPTVTASRGPGIFSAGTYTITYTARDASGNTAYCSFSVHVNPAADTVAPVLAGCPQGTIVFTIPAGQTQTFAIWNIPTATDSVDPNPTVTVSQGPGIFSAGTYNIVYTAMDASGNTANCLFTVQVNPAGEAPPNNVATIAGFGILGTLLIVLAAAIIICFVLRSKVNRGSRNTQAVASTVEMNLRDNNRTTDTSEPAEVVV